MADCLSRPIGLKQVHVHPPRGYLDRNTDIVKHSHILIGCPSTLNEVLRSGTWATIRRARRIKTPCILIFPDGSLKFSWQNLHKNI